MNTVRQQRILAWLGERGTVSAGELRATFGVTAMTIWRDLRELDEQGLIFRVRGGALLRTPASSETGFEAKVTAADAAKRRIAARAVSAFVRPGDVIALEGGTTVASLVEFLPQTRISVVTNSLPVATRLRADRPGLPVAMPGGWLSAVSGNLCGPDAVRWLAIQESAVCFIGATGFDAERGPLDPNPLEIEAKRAMTEKARRVVLLLDASKWGQAALCVTLHPRRIHTVVTDRQPPKAIARMLKVHKVCVMEVC